ncbi:MAG: hypothetical protein KBS65_00695 [Prevotella sp.]|nr:hypothetical protein [Candidatus Equicola stercoris]
MKKLVYLFVAVAALSIASCGNKTQENVEAVDTVDTTVVDTVDTTVVDTVAADTAVVAE